MENIHFTDEAIVGLIIQGILMIIIPIVLLIIWKIRTKESIVPVIIGAVTWLAFAIILKLAPAYLLLYADNPVAKTISGNVWLTGVLAGVLAGVFEETGRFLAFKFVLKSYDHRLTSVTYGIGHGGFESAYVGFQIFAFAIMGIMINNGMGDMLINGADEAQIAVALGQLEQESQVTIGECLLGTFERIPAIVSHISFSVLVFAAVREKRYFWLYPLAIVLHGTVDFSTAFYNAGMVSVLGLELIITGFDVALAIFASVIYKKLNRGNEKAAA